MAIPIPESLRLKRDKKAERELLDKSREWLTKEVRTPGVHASSLLDPRMAYFEKLNPRTLDDRLVLTFLIGKVLHAFVISALDGATGTDWESDSGSRTSKELGIEYSIDHIKDGIPNELKTSRKPFEPREVKDMDMYIEQTLIYMAAENSTVGKITVLFLSMRTGNGNNTEPAYRSYTVTVSQEDLERVKDFIKTTVTLLNVAWKNNEFSALPLCRQFKCGPKNCAHWEACKPEGRYPRKTKGAWKA